MGIGDFTFVIWDGRKKRLFAARDHAGIRPFFFHAGPDHFVFGSALAQVLKHTAVSRRVNEGMVAKSLTSAISSKEETLFADIQRLPPGRCLCVGADRFSIRTYWNAAPREQIRYRHFDEYVEHFLELLHRAVDDRLRCVGPPGMLSGGLDSPTIAGVAQTILSERGEQRPLDAFTLTFPGLEIDESHYVKAVARRWGLKTHQFPYTHL